MRLGFSALGAIGSTRADPLAPSCKSIPECTARAMTASTIAAPIAVPKVADVRVTLIWTETNLALLADPQPKGAPLAGLGREALYARLFEESLRGTAVPADLEPPWPNRAGTQRFWRSYLKIGRGKTLSALPGGSAWRYLVPFRRRVPCTVTIPGIDGVRLLVEGFYYPHGTALVVTIHATWPEASPRDLLLASGFLHDVVTGARLVSVTWPPGAAQSQKLNRLVTPALTWLRESAIGPGAEPGDAGERPYTVTTFVALRDVDPEQPTPDQQTVHRCLAAVTDWLPDWQINALSPLADCRAAIRPAPPSHVCYVGARGVAVWYPAPAVEPKGPTTLSCYHRNQVFAAMQIESVNAMLRKLNGLAAGGEVVSPTADECGRLGAGIAGRLYGGVDTYRSGSARSHIDQRFVAQVNTARARYGMGALH